MVHWPMILSGLGRMQTDLGDTRFNNYVLEHSYRWFRGEPNHADFWSPPMFFPTRNAASYSDLLLSVAPIYGAFRWLGLAADTSFQLWMIAVSGLNFAMAFHLLRRRLGLGPMAACAGAFLFAFGAPRINQLGHEQLLPQFFSLVTVDALLGLFADDGAGPGRRGMLWLAAGLGLVAQFYEGFYLGYFLFLAIGFAAGLALLWPSTRGALLATLRRDALPIAATAAVCGLLMGPMVLHYLDAARTVEKRNFFVVTRPIVASWKSLLYLGPDSWLWGWPSRLGFSPRPYEGEKRLGIGMITTLACAVGLYWNRGRPAIRLIAAAGLIVLLLGISVPRNAAIGLAMAVIYLSLAGLYQVRRDHPWMRLVAPGAVLALILADALGSKAQAGIGLYTLLLVASDLSGCRDEPRIRLALGGLALGLGLSLFSPAVLAIGAGAGAVTAGAAAIFGLRSYGQVAPVALAVALLVACLATYSRQPAVLVAAVLVPPALALTRSARLRPSAETTFASLVLALIAAAVYRDSDTGWYALSLYVPGASAIRALGRVVLMALMVYAIGLGLFVKGMHERRRPVAAIAIALICFLEQGLSTPSYDKREHRSTVDAIASRIDRRDAILYFSAHRAEVLTPDEENHLSTLDNLDAIWAGLERGVPTINGYSGNLPPGWAPLSHTSVRDDGDSSLLDRSLRRWAREHGLPVERIRWVGGPRGWPRDDAAVALSPNATAPSVPTSGR
jgi:hypothetical protein